MELLYIDDVLQSYGDWITPSIQRTNINKVTSLAFRGKQKCPSIPDVFADLVNLDIR